jgi:cleavage and polyadenylation specificity factor subunit 3
MMRLKSKLLSLNASLPASRKVKVFSPKNCEELRIPFKAEKIAKVVGKLADMPPASLTKPLFLEGGDQGDVVAHDEGKIITGVLVQDVFKLSLMAPEDLREYAGLTTTVVLCKQRLRLSAAGADLIKWALEGTFGSVDELATTSKPDDGGDTYSNGNAQDDPQEAAVDHKHERTYVVMGCITVRLFGDGEVEVEWEGNMLNDGIADAVMAVLYTVESSPAAVKRGLIFA